MIISRIHTPNKGVSFGEFATCSSESQGYDCDKRSRQDGYGCCDGILFFFFGSGVLKSVLRPPEDSQQKTHSGDALRDIHKRGGGQDDDGEEDSD